MKKATAAIQVGYNTLLGFNGVAIIVALLSKHFAEAAAITALAFVITANHMDIERRMAFGARASLPKPDHALLGEHTQQELDHMRGNYALNLIFYIGWAIFAFAIAKNMIAATLFIVQAKLVVEQHREMPSRYVVGISHTIPPIIFMLLLPPGMILARILAACGSILLFSQSAIAISTLAKADRDLKRIKRKN